MKKIIVFLALCAFTLKISQAQEGYVMFLGLYLDPAPGKSVALLDGLKEHNRSIMPAVRTSRMYGT
ncbi:MAG: hypothetical protein HC811_01685 [Flammeovirgaceae bacterium]|nr:hypothetical protein [Flammeovirgaceae bacterium]